ncbi:peptidoglycan recognition protein-like isoform X3 [Zootermopsis nevadensis]|uniref:peptidoglycan recognition protein-like isoform X3 n=1 Tax=Zootermopsis nevadensis TaxID=136037 RepID=UPI000B8EE5C2|nr:peptidoglycan recognition protein-like isoform X3 [Zootermopsis nevadensis]
MATLIGSIQNPHGESHHHTAAAAKYNKMACLCLHWRIFLPTLAVIVLLVIILTAIIIHFSSSSRDDLPKQTFYPAPEDPEPNPNTTLPGDHVIYSKEDWYGVAPKFERQLKHPTPFVVISHTATPACYSPVVCAARMRNFQDVHMGDSHNFPDIGYSFVVGGDGNVYVGRGWDATNMHSGFVKRCNIGISFIGNFVHDTPTNGQIQAVQELIKLGVSLGKIDKNYKLVAMNETFTTLSPGVVLYGIIAKWPHFWKPSHDDIGMCPYTV